ncbi:hypothetical protein V3C99_017995 [Haemonchus contortus]|uniref:Uncharacterized protein n=1 Tax=Haemonchus contortus TaxID=6289 RepID=A0A7I4Z682_HAECO|nr:unnamed protein product [Haemonchus contortus]
MAETQVFAFPNQMEKCKEYIKERTSMLNYLEKLINSAIQFHNTRVKEAIENITGRVEQKEREKLMLDMNKHLELESNMLEVAITQWLDKIEFRKDELVQQSALIASSQGSNNHTVTSAVKKCLLVQQRHKNATFGYDAHFLKSLPYQEIIGKSAPFGHFSSRSFTAMTT